MVTVLEVREVSNKDGNTYNIMIVGSEPKMVSSANGNYRFVSLKTSIPSNLPLSTLENMIGEKITGSVIKRECEPYSFNNVEGEEITLDYRYVYTPEERD